MLCYVICLALQACGAAAWPKDVAEGAGYTLAELAPCLRELARTHANATKQPYQAIVDKYRNNKSVSNFIFYAFFIS